MQTTINYLTVPGATLYYETYGLPTKPPLIFISGAQGTADIWRPLASLLSSTPSFPYNIIIYDRRGFSRSYLSTTTAQDYPNRLNTDADDVAALITHLSPNTPATVLGTSSGAIVALTTLLRHPSLLKTLIAHEPPLISLLPDASSLAPQQRAIYSTYRASGIPSALREFAVLNRFPLSEIAGLGTAFDAKTNPYIAGNAALWFEREMVQYPLTEFEAGGLKGLEGKLVLVNARESDREALFFRANVVLGGMLGLRVGEMPGGHVGYVTHVREWAEGLVGVLGGR